MQTLAWGVIGLFMLGMVIFPWMFIVAIPLLLVTAFVLSPVAYFGWLGYQSLKVKKVFRVLVADDDEISIAPLYSALSRRPVEVFFVENGKDILKALKKHKFDMLFLDIMMPGLRGDSVLRVGERILESKRDKKIPVVFYTGNHDKVKGLMDEQFSLFNVRGIWAKTMSSSSLDKSLDQVFSVA